MLVASEGSHRLLQRRCDARLDPLRRDVYTRPSCGFGGAHNSIRLDQTSKPDGAIAQLVERLNGIQEVRGSTPLGSTILFGQSISKIIPKLDAEFV